MELIAVTVQTSSRMPVGRNAFQEVGVSLSFSVRDEEGADVATVIPQAGDLLEAAFHALWRKLDGYPEQRSAK